MCMQQSTRSGKTHDKPVTYSGRIMQESRKMQECEKQNADEADR